MNRSESISRWEMTVLTAVTVAGTTFLALPRQVAIYAANAAWLSILIAGLGGIVLILLITALAERFPDLNPAQYSEYLLGGVLGKVATMVLVIFGHLYLGLLLREFAGLFLIPFMPETPISAFLIIMALLLVYGVFQGISGISRSAQVFLPVIVLSLVVIIFGSLVHFNAGRLLPVTGLGAPSIGRGAWQALGYIGDIFLLTFVAPSLRRKPDLPWALINGLIAAVIVLAAICAVSVGVFGAETLRVLTFPTLSVARLIRIGPFFERFEIVFVVVWFFLSFLKLSVLLFVILKAMSSLFALSDHRPLAPAVGAVVALLAVLPPNELALARYTTYFTTYGQSVELGLPLLWFLAALVRGKGGPRHAVEK